MGDIYFKRVVSNKAPVTDPSAVQQILDRYECSLHIEVIVDEQTGKGCLDIKGEEEWPGAVLHEDLGTRGNGLDESEFVWYLDGALQVGGKAGFIQLLRDLAPLLETPLVVQAVDFATCGYTLYHPVRVCEWYVKPGATEVEVNEFKHSEELPESMSGSG